MRVVVDANELFAGIIAKGKELQSWSLDLLFSDDVELVAPFRLLAGLEKNRRRSGTNQASHCRSSKSLSVSSSCESDLYLWSNSGIRFPKRNGMHPI
jgi:hypothetical protein